MSAPDPAVVQTVARELANHQGLRGPMDESRPDVWQNRCDCGWDDGDERPGWRERYRLHVAAAAIAALPTADTETLRDVLLKHHPIAHTMTGLLKGCRCGQVKLGQNVIAHVVDHLRAALASPAPAPQCEEGQR